MRLILDVDGTLVDSNFHHALARQRALSGEGVEIAHRRILRAIGMGGDRVLSQLPGAREAVVHAAAVFGPPAVMIGDTPWDAAAAPAAGVPCHGVLTGGRSVIDLKAAGCVAVHEDIGAAVAHLAASRQP